MSDVTLLEETKGRIFNIQRYSLHDGGGIRTIVFLKGCFLRCRWCCNPESQRHEVEAMTINGKTETVGRDVTVAEVMAEVERDRHYYRRSGGGITLSGGEALAQAEFSYALLRAASENGIHTAMESTAMAEFDKIEKLLPYLNEFLLDIKHTDAAKHEEFTNKRNELAVENAKKIALSGMTNLIIRVPVIPGFNATEKEIADIARFAASLPGVTEIHLLPYHRFGEGKYAGMGRDYPMGDAKPPGDAEMKRFKQAIESVAMLTCKIGG